MVCELPEGQWKVLPSWNQMDWVNKDYFICSKFHTLFWLLLSQSFVYRLSHQSSLTVFALSVLTSISSLADVLPFTYMHLYYIYCCFLSSVAEPCFGLGYITVFLYTFPVFQLPGSQKWNSFLNYQTCLKFSAIHIDIYMFFWNAFCWNAFWLCGVIAFCNEFLKTF